MNTSEKGLDLRHIYFYTYAAFENEVGYYVHVGNSNTRNNWFYIYENNKFKAFDDLQEAALSLQKIIERHELEITKNGHIY